MSIRILHTADWQIGKQFANVPGDPGAALRKPQFSNRLLDSITARPHPTVLVCVLSEASWVQIATL